MRKQKALRVLAPMAIAVTAGCAWVRPMSVSPEISADQATPGGTPRDTIDYLKEKYPPKFWKPASSGSRVAVGPAYLYREAALMLTGDAPEEIRVQAKSGTSRSIATVRKGDSHLFFYIEATSQEVQSIVVEQLVKHPSFQVFTFDESDTKSLIDDTKTFEQMRREGIRYYVEGTVKTAEGKGDMPTKVFLRFTDTLTQEIICSTRGEGRDVSSAARDAAVSLAQSLNPPEEPQEAGG